MSDHADFGPRLRSLRTAAGLTVAALAAQVGVSRQTIASIETGIYLPRWSVACKIADALGVSVAEFRR